MKLKGITDNGQRIKYPRRYAGAEHTNIWKKEERRVFEANGGEGVGRPTHMNRWWRA